MRDLIELASMVSNDLPPMKRQEEICSLILQELQSLNGKDLAPRLSDFAVDMVEPCVRIVLKFPVGAHICNSVCSEFKGDRLKRNNADSTGIDGL